jgi:hypothetical protein
MIRALAAGDDSAARWPSGRRTSVRARLLRRSFAALERAAARFGRTLIVLEYPPSAELRPRWGHGRPPHPGLARLVEQGRERYDRRLQTMAPALAALADQVPVAAADDGVEPYWDNIWLSGLDAVSLVHFLAERDPATYVEVGSGMSTRWAHHAIRTRGLRTRITSIDPVPRKDVAGLCHVQLRQPLELAALDPFARLEPGDVVFVDGSHRTFQNSDATVFALDVLPALPAGVLVGVHDVLLPADYPPAWARRHYSEQYLLAAYLLGGAPVRVELPCHFVETDAALGARWRELWAANGPDGVLPGGQAFWFEVG